MPLYLCSEPNDSAFRASLVIAFKGQSIECFDGGSLRNTIERCESCLFIATRASVNSASCWLQLGAFLFADIRIFFLLSGDVTERDFPPQFIVQDNLISRDLGQLIGEIKKEISEVSGKRYAAEQKRKSEVLEKPRLVSDLSIDMFFNVLSSSIKPQESLVKPQESLVYTMILLRESFYERIGENYSESLWDSADSPDLMAFAFPLLTNLLGKLQDEVQPPAERFFGHYSFQFISTSGEEFWGFALEKSYFATCFENCLLFHYQNSSVDSVFLSSAVGISTDPDGDSFNYYKPIICRSGSVEIGEISEFKPRDNLFRDGSIPLFGG